MIPVLLPASARGARSGKVSPPQVFVDRSSTHMELFGDVSDGNSLLEELTDLLILSFPLIP
jgi:hypothetical protein